MRRSLQHGHDDATASPQDHPTLRTVVALALVVLVPTAGLRAWMLYPSWFYFDDLRLMAEATENSFSLTHLLEPYDSQFMPAGRALVWWVAHSGDVPAQWGLVATLTLILWIATGLACLWMLLELFGPRWGVVALLAVHATTALTAPATMWWAASLNQLPLIVVWYSAVAAWVRYLRTRSMWWLIVTLAALAVGGLFYIKVLLVLPILVVLMLGWFVRGRPTERLRHAVRAYWPAALLLGTAAAGFTWFYSARVPQPFVEDPTPGLAWRLATELLGRDFATVALGGPWQWEASNPPVALVDPPAAMLVAVAVILAAAVLWMVAHRRVGGPLVLLVSLSGAYLLVLTTRAPLVGSLVGREPRYLTETVCALVLSMGLVTMSVRGSVLPEPRPIRGGRATRNVGLALAVAICVSGALSSAAYARVWHDDNPVDAYLHRFAADVARAGKPTVADQAMPTNMTPFVAPYNRLSVVGPLVSDSATYPLQTDRLTVLDDDGGLNVAVIEPTSRGLPGPVPDCGWKVTGKGRTIALDAAIGGFEWWVRVPYLASAESPVEVTVGATTRQSTVQPGLGSIYVYASGPFEDVRVDGLEPNVVVCVGEIEVGQPEPGGPVDVE